MIKLPLEILDLIFKELSLKEKVQLALTAKFLRDAFLYSCGNEFREINYHDHLPDYFISIFQMCGSFIIKLDVSDLKAHEFVLVEKNCPNLQTLKLSYITKEHFTVFNSMVHGAKNLRAIHLPLLECYELADKITHALRDLPNLKVFEFTAPNYRNEKGFFELANICTYANLEELTIRTFGIKLAINEIFNSLTRLSFLELDLVDIDSTTGEVPKCSYLEVLKLKDFDINNALPLCPRLRHLSLIRPDSHSNIKLLEWIETQSKTLESLSMDDGLHRLYWFHSRKEPDFPALKSLVYSGWGPSALPRCSKLQLFRLKLSADRPTSRSALFNWISRHAETLECLDLPAKMFVYTGTVPYLPRLRSLCLRSATVGLGRVSEWISKQSETLYSLEMDSIFFNVLDLCQLMSLCKKVRILTVLGHRRLLEASWIPFFDTLKDNKVTVDEPVIINVNSMNYYEENIQWLFVKKVAKHPNFELCKFKFLEN